MAKKAKREFTATPTDPYSGATVGETRTWAVNRPAPGVQTAPPPSETAEVPDGTIDAVLEWVGYDPGRAKAAIAAEHGRDKPRSTLLAELSERTGHNG